MLFPDHKQPERKIKVSKYLFHISIRELHTDLISEISIYQLKLGIGETTGKTLISDTALHALIPKNFRKTTDKYKQMCGCKICVIICSIQASLNPYQLKHLKLLREKARNKGGQIVHLGVDSTEKSNSYANDVYPNNQHMYLSPRDALLSIKFNSVDGFSFPHFRCVLQQ